MVEEIQKERFAESENNSLQPVSFTPNDCYLAQDENVWLLTGLALNSPLPQMQLIWLVASSHLCPNSNHHVGLIWAVRAHF